MSEEKILSGGAGLDRGARWQSGRVAERVAESGRETTASNRFALDPASPVAEANGDAEQLESRAEQRKQRQREARKGRRRGQ
jgi:hypothetical protein